MLEAILQVRPKDEVTIEEEDKRIINKCNLYFIFFILFIHFFLLVIDSIRNRIIVLRRKMEASERV